MKRYQKVLFPVVVILQLCVLSVMIARQEILLAKGTKVTLKCEPIDPRSLFSGDYVILSYSISSFTYAQYPNLSDQQNPYREHDTVYAGLVREGEFHTAKEVSRSLEYIKGRYPVFLKGQITDIFGDMVRVRYGVESYFVPQNEGKIIEQELKNVSVEISVDEKGKSAISRLFVAGKEVKFY